jgi:two-component system, NarL family, response regulator NreC
MTQNSHVFACDPPTRRRRFAKSLANLRRNCVPPRTDLKEVVFSGRKIRCLLVHGHVLLRQGLRRLLQDEPDIEVVSEAGNAAECLRKLYEFRPDVLLADAGTFEQPASEAELLVARESPQTRIVFLTTEEQGISPVGGLQAASAGFAVRQTSAQELVAMIRNSYAGMAVNRMATNHIATNHVATSHIAANHIPISHTPSRHPAAAPSRRDLHRSDETLSPQERALTAREQEVLKLLAEGKTVRVAAMVLGVSSKTVDAHKFNLMRKLGIHNKAQLVMWAIQRKVVKIPANF